jgi:hypothetical protein
MKKTTTTLAAVITVAAAWILTIAANQHTASNHENLNSFNQGSEQLIGFSLPNSNTGNANITITDDSGEKVSDQPFFGKSVYVPTNKLKEGVYSYIVTNGKQIIKGAFSIR